MLSSGLTAQLIAVAAPPLVLRNVAAGVEHEWMMMLMSELTIKRTLPETTCPNQSKAWFSPAKPRYTSDFVYTKKELTTLSCVRIYSCNSQVQDEGRTQ